MSRVMRRRSAALGAAAAALLCLSSAAAAQAAGGQVGNTTVYPGATTNMVGIAQAYRFTAVTTVPSIA